MLQVNPWTAGFKKFYFGFSGNILLLATILLLGNVYWLFTSQLLKSYDFSDWESWRNINTRVNLFNQKILNSCLRTKIKLDFGNITKMLTCNAESNIVISEFVFVHFLPLILYLINSNYYIESQIKFSDNPSFNVFMMDRI